MKLEKHFSKECIHFLPKEVSTPKDVIRFLTASLSMRYPIVDHKKCEDAVLEREKIVSTGIGLGISLPHARMPHLDDFYIAIAIHQEGIDWHSLDHNPVHIVFLIAGPSTKQMAYLQMLSFVTSHLKEESMRQKLISAKDNNEILKLIEMWTSFL